jgi:hypothetical protein
MESLSIKQPQLSKMLLAPSSAESPSSPGKRVTQRSGEDKQLSKVEKTVRGDEDMETGSQLTRFTLQHFDLLNLEIADFIPGS